MNGKELRTVENGTFSEERAFFGADSVRFLSSEFASQTGESPMKHGKNLAVDKCAFNMKYPLWYCDNVDVKNTEFFVNSRAGIWYTKNLTADNCKIEAPKLFRRCDGLVIKNTVFSDAQETLWECKNVTLENVTAMGADYICMNSDHIRVKNFRSDGKYAFDGCTDIIIEDSELDTKDVFWNCENVTVKNCRINSEYIGWNSKNLTFIDCEIESLQGFCYIDNLVIRNCDISAVNLAFEYSAADVEARGRIESIKNPARGRIVCDGIGEIILNPERINPGDTEIIIRGEQ